MKLTLKRIFQGETYTIGKLYLNGKYFCDSIEDTIRELPPTCPDTPKWIACKCQEKVMHETAIPAGTYKVTMEYSPKFKRKLPYLHNVPHFLGILIHSGNTAQSSSGCIIVGKNKVKGQVLESRVTLEALIKRIEGQKNITITIE